MSSFKGFLKVVIRLLIAFICGWLFAAIDQFWHVLTYVEDALNVSTGSVLFYLLFLLCIPLGLGVAAALTLNRGNKHLISLAALTGLLALAGWGVYWFPILMSQDASEVASCAHSYCHVTGSLNTMALIIVLFNGSVFVLLGSAVTGLVIRLIMKQKRRAREGGSR